MGSVTRLVFCVVLLLCYKDNTESQEPCPERCQCFTGVQVICSDVHMTSLPKILSTQMTELIVMTTSLPYLFANIYEESPQLTKLIFINNALRDIHARAFDNLTEVEEIEISGNPAVVRMFLGTFSNQGNLNKLLLNFNRLTTVLPGMFDPLAKLETLQIKGNLISYLPTHLFKNLHNLTVLDLSQNKLEHLERQSFYGLDKLEKLKLDYNLISQLSSDTFHNVSQLTELNLEGNKISDLPLGIFSVLTKLEVLNLRGNLLSNLSQEVFGEVSSSLKKLSLNGNRLKVLHSHLFRGLNYLTHLSLSANQLSKLPVDIFQNLTGLVYLDLSENQLTLLPGKIFIDLSFLEVMDLRNNNLTGVDAELLKSQLLLQQLFLSNNQLQTLPPGFVDPFLFSPVVELHGNPWQCDCHMWYLHDLVLKQKDVHVNKLDKVLCKGPGPLTGQIFTSIDKEQLVCGLTERGSFVLQNTDCSVLIKCKMTKCPPHTVKIEFQMDDSTVFEHIVKNNQSEHLQCNNDNNYNDTMSDY